MLEYFRMVGKGGAKTEDTAEEAAPSSGLKRADSTVDTAALVAALHPFGGQTHFCQSALCEKCERVRVLLINLDYSLPPFGQGI